MNKPLKERATIIQRRLIADDRGWFLKAITGTEEGIPTYTGEVYLTMGKLGKKRIGRNDGNPVPGSGGLSVVRLQ